MAENEFRKGWPAVLVVFLGCALGTPSMPMYGFALLLGPVARDFHWDLPTTAGGLAVFTVCMALGGPIIGRVVDRIGTYRVLLLSLPTTFAAFAALALVNGNRPAYYALWAVIGLCGVGNNPIVWTRLLALRFDRQRGLALGIASAGAAFFLLAVTPAARAILDALGWKAALLFMSALPVAVLLPATLVVLRPVHAGPGADRAQADATPRARLSGIVRSRPFLILLFANLCMAAVPGIITHLETLYHVHRLPTGLIITLTSAMGLSLFAGKLVAGYLSDKMWTPALLATALLFPASAALGLSLGPLGVPVYVLCAMGIGFGAGAEFQLGAYVTAQYFGLRHYGLIFGIFYSVALGLGGLWSLVIGKLVATSGGYAAPFQMLAATLATGAVSLCFMGRPQRFDDAPARGLRSGEANSPRPVPAGAMARE